MFRTKSNWRQRRFNITRGVFPLLLAFLVLASFPEEAEANPVGDCIDDDPPSFAAWQPENDANFGTVRNICDFPVAVWICHGESGSSRCDSRFYEGLFHLPAYGTNRAVVMYNGKARHYAVCGARGKNDAVLWSISDGWKTHGQFTCKYGY